VNWRPVKTSHCIVHKKGRELLLKGVIATLKVDQKEKVSKRYKLKQIRKLKKYS